MNYDLELRARAYEAQGINEKQRSFLSCVRDLHAPWGTPVEAGQYPVERDSWPCVARSLTRYFGKGVKAQACYRSRVALEDAGHHDDFIVFSFRASKIDFSYLVGVTLPAYVHCFGAYRASIAPEFFLNTGFVDPETNAWRPTGSDFRRTIERFAPVNFFDRELLAASLSATPEELAERLSGVSEAFVAEEGLYLRSGVTPLPPDQARGYEEGVARALSVPSPWDRFTCGA
jgi:hypothetical protein